MNTIEELKVVRRFIERNFRHFNAGTMKRAADAYNEHLEKGGKMMIAMAGAMSTAELGITLAEMIRQDKVHAITCTGANLEEDIFNLVAHDYYVSVPDYRYFDADDEEALLKRQLNRVTDVCIPEEEAMIRVEGYVMDRFRKAHLEGKRFFPHEILYQCLLSGELEKFYQIDPKNSWMLAAAQKNLPIYVPGWEDSTLGNVFVAKCMKGIIGSISTAKTGLEYMEHLVGWYKEASAGSSIGFFQIGGGISGDFPICCVPLITQDLKEKIGLWGYFCQISDSTTSYGSYSGAVPNEKITWGKLSKNTPSYVIESDATIVSPLMFAYILSHGK